MVTTLMPLIAEAGFCSECLVFCTILHLTPHNQPQAVHRTKGSKAKVQQNLPGFTLEVSEHELQAD
jgi:hypothetical protein